MTRTTDDKGLRFISMMVMLIVLIVSGFLLAGCDPGDIPPAQIPDVCRALIGPIKYNTYNKNSQRYAAYLLGMDLAERNRVYTALHCPKV